MLSHLRQHTHDILASAKTATLSTSGPAGLQARPFPCEALDIRLYLLVPSISDQLLNLEQDPTAVASTTRWVLRGEGRVLSLSAAPPALRLPLVSNADGCVLVELQPRQLQVYQDVGWGFRETIDIDPNL
jgi:hypothetical protein